MTTNIANSIARIQGTQLKKAVALFSKLKLNISEAVLSVRQGSISIAAMYGGTGLKVTLPSDSIGKDDCEIDLQGLKDILGRVKGIIEIATNGSIVISTQTGEITLPFIPGKLSLPNVKQETASVYSEDLQKNLRKVLPFSATSENKRNLYGVLVEVTDSGLRMVASDGFRLGYADTAAVVSKGEAVIIPLQFAQLLQGIIKIIPDSEVSIRADKSAVKVQGEYFELVFARPDFEFPDYRRILPGSFRATLEVSREELLEAVNRSTGADKVRLTREGEVISITGKIGEGNFVHKVSVAGEGELKAAYNPKFLKDALVAMDCELVSLGFVETNSPLQLTPEEGVAEKYLVMPIREF
ncbi:MAG TPA: DNA polymerase III subunit beta [Mesotoga infera]|mgnify:CR=1 FL=1|jgi:DNA polymerase-3 subunit beta|nr:DNA polymerase III subunit beta [Mesotoga infera]HPD39275.1 DNA polymerase III subunit beta [Mesotoga infera]